ncbi:hypothetical protein [Pelagicoccus mobilis]|uniref:Uncharacterized protein n=1 Tax=Pelagicoccus mobilis TaxID=415221 RepID=A0A934RZI7_9BACT|nr:hypothetical protein [Pelagicoccus mobilis]MBK1878415.1 hypothetical protein [Pelagicoccus mobilis]
MTQSDSPDFEFDISDLEVEGSAAPASNAEDAVPGSKDESNLGKQEQGSGDQEFRSDDRSEEDLDEAALEGFAIDELPDAFSSEEASAPAETDADAIEPEPAEAQDPGSDEDVQEVTRVASEKEAKPTRTLGADDLGADVFAEMDDDSSAVSFSDVIDDLMDEVEDFEAGGFVDLEQEAKASQSEKDDLFKMDDPDDSLGQSIDPNAVEEEEPEAEAPSFPSPPADFEIPADPEPEAVVPEEPETAQAPEPISDERVEPVATNERPPQPVSRSPQTEIPVQGSMEKVEAKIPEPPTAETVEEKSAAAFDPEMVIPADLPEPSAPVEQKIEGSAPEPSSDVPEEEVMVESEAIGPIEPALEDEAVEPVDGHEKVLFDAAEEEQADVLPEEDAAAVESEPAVLEEEAVPEPVIEEISEADEDSVPEAVEAPASEEVETSAEVEADLDLAAVEFEEEEEDLSALIDATLDSEETQEAADDVLEEPLEEAEELAVENEPSAELVEDGEDDPVALPTLEEEVEVAEEPVSVDESEVEDIPVVLDEEEEDLSELIEAGSAEEETAEPEVEEIVASEEPLQELDVEDEDEVVELPSPEDLVSALEPEPAEEPEPVEAAVEAGDLEDEEDLSELVAGLQVEEEASPEENESLPETPSLTVEDEEDEEIVSLPVPEVPGLVEVEEEIAEESEEVTVESNVPAAPPSAEELLMQASSLLNGDSKKPAEGASDLLDELDGDDEDIVALPSPEAMMADVAESEIDDEEVVAMPDPASLITEAGEDIAVIDDEEEEEDAPGNVADRAGDLPPPPPAPVEILDEEPPEEDSQAAVEPEPSAEVSDPEPTAEEDGLQDPFAGEISLDDFSDELGEIEGLVEDDESIIDALDSEIEDDETVESAPAAAAQVVEMPKPSLLWRITHSMAVAAGFVLVGLASVLAVWKQQIIEFYEGRDIDGSALIHEIESVSNHALEEFDESGLYRMQWVDSEVRRVSKNEIRLHALIGAQLRENLYKPVLESELKDKFGYDEESLLGSLSYAHQHFPEEIGRYPDKPWERLYELSAAKGEVLSLRVIYGLTRPNKDADWQLSRVKVSGYKEKLTWPEGETKYAFGEGAYDIDSLEFSKVFSEYKLQSNEYVARIDRLKTEVENGRLALKRENDRQRERVKMALSEGAYFNGIAILGEDAVDSEDVQLVITEVRNEGSFVKGVLRLNRESEERSKHFVGSLAFEKTLSGKEQGYLNLTTVSMDTPGTLAAESTFFQANTVSRMKLKADGFRLEGDTRDLSFRLTRSM